MNAADFIKYSKIYLAEKYNNKSIMAKKLEIKNIDIVDIMEIWFKIHSEKQKKGSE